MNTYQEGCTTKRFIAIMVASMAVLTLSAAAILFLTLSESTTVSNGSVPQRESLSHFGAISISPSAEQSDTLLFVSSALAGPLVDPSIDAPIVNPSIVDASVDSSGGGGSLANSSLSMSSTKGPIRLPDATAPSDLSDNLIQPSVVGSSLKGPLT